ncbi:MAG: sel1 repeat family protein [Dokdonella sp.]
MRRSPRFIQAVLASSIALSGLSFAQYEAAMIRGSTARNSASSDSPDADDRRKGYIEPSESGRPGVFFFAKGAEAFKKDQAAFAIEMYEISASYAYKPAQYNLSVIYAKGQGVAVDLPRALAWVTLAAERSDAHYATARNAIYAALSPQQVDEADRVLKSLVPKYADETAMKRAKSRWKDAKLAATGSRLGFIGGLKVGAPGAQAGGLQASSQEAKKSTTFGSTAWDLTGGNQVDGSVAYRQLRESDNPYDPKFKERTGTVKIGDIETDNTDVAKSATEDAAKQN